MANNLAKLFITNISTKVSRCVIYEVLIQASRISGFYYNQKKGYCFVEYHSREELEYTCAVLSGIKLHGRKLYLTKVEEQSRIIVRNIGAEIDEIFLWDVFSKFGSCRVELEENGIGVVVYRKREHALRAMVVDGKIIGNSRISVEESH